MLICYIFAFLCLINLRYLPSKFYRLRSSFVPIFEERTCE